MRVILLLPLSLAACTELATPPSPAADDSDFQCDFDPSIDLVDLRRTPLLPPPPPPPFLLDTDGDGILNAIEILIGTSPADPDTDDDGLPDGLEYANTPATGFDFVAAGADPLHRDMFLEVHYEIDGADSAKLGPLLLDELDDFYDALPIDNPDGTTGIVIHVYQDTVLPAGFDCATASARMYPSDFFRQAKLCLSTGGVSGVGGGNTLRVIGPATNANPLDDATEVEQHAWFRVLIHELGHTLGLGHGDTIRQGGFEPNYPSVMNYGYTPGIAGGTTLADHTIAYSPGLITEVLDECAVLEVPAFATEAPFLASYAPKNGNGAFDYVFVGGETFVNWNRDLAYAIVPIQADLNGDGQIGATAEGGCTSTSFEDNDDFAEIASQMANALPGAP